MLEDCGNTNSGNMPFSEDTEESPDDSSSNRLLSSLKASRGVLLTLLSATLLAFSAEFMSKASKAGIPGFQLNFFMRLTEFLTILPLIAFTRPKLTTENVYQTVMFVLAVTVNNVAIVLTFLSFTLAVPGMQFGITNGSIPFFVACVGFIFLKEAVNFVNFCGIVINVIGVVMIAVGTAEIGGASTQQLVLSIAIPLLAALTSAPDVVLTRYVTSVLGIPVATTLLYSYLVGTVALLGITYAAETPLWTMSARTSLYIVGLGLSKALATFAIAHALKVEKAYITAAAFMFVIPFTILLDYIFQRKVPNAYQGCGVALVMVGTVVVSTYTWWSYRQQAQQRSFLQALRFDPQAGENYGTGVSN